MFLQFRLLRALPLLLVGSLGWVSCLNLMCSSVEANEVSSGEKVAANDLTSKLEDLGSPFLRGEYSEQSPFARNVIMMQPFHNRLYLGHGDGVENEGPIPLWAYNPSTQQFRYSFVAPEESIDIFRAIGSSLYTPGIDATQSWQYGSIYQLNERGWKQFRMIPEGLHVDDLEGFAGQLWAPVRREDVETYLVASADGGKTWKDVYNTESDYGRLQVFEDSLYVLATNGVVHVDGDLRVRQRPDIDEEGDTVKILNDRDPHDYSPGLFVAHSLAVGHIDVERIPLGRHEVPFDIFTNDTGAYVLTSERIDSDGGYYFLMRVRRSTDLQTWDEYLRFRDRTFARSFAFLDGSWYFGLGTGRGVTYDPNSYTEYVEGRSGTILRSPAE
jgi:hypothetical protein